MKVLQVLTFVGPGNPFGGPARVATNQATELRRRGHEVVIAAAQPAAAARGSWKSTDVMAFDSRPLLRRAGFAGIVSMGLYRYLWKNVRNYDVVHVHMARDLVTIPAAIIARLRKVPYVLQTHGMIDESHRRSARVLDAIATKWIVAGAARVFVLTPREMDDIASLMGKRHFNGELLQNGITVDADATPRPATDEVPEALFCSRLHIRKRPTAFVQAAIDLLAEGVRARFAVVGPDEGELAAVQALLEKAGHPDGIAVEPPLEPDEVKGRLVRCSVLVLPAVDEPFGMIVVEALAIGRPVIITESCGLADFVRQNSCGLVVAADHPVELAAAMRRMLLDTDSASEMGVRGLSAVTVDFGIEQVVDRLTMVYRGSSEPCSDSNVP